MPFNENLEPIDVNEMKTPFTYLLEAKARFERLDHKIFFPSYSRLSTALTEIFQQRRKTPLDSPYEVHRTRISVMFT